MLQAMLKDGSLVTLANYSRKEIERFRREKKFFCPTCRSRLILKAGQKVIPHFAHKGPRLCPSSYGEGPEHELGKFLIYQFFLRQNFTVYLEKYLSNLRQTPDILLSVNDRSIAIEYQRASLSRADFLKRTRTYLDQRIVPLWVLGENQFLRLSAHSLRLTPLLKSFLHKFSSNCKSTLYFFCPHSKQFSFFQNLYFPENNRAIGKFSFLPLEEFSFLDFFCYKTFSRHDLFQLWLTEKINFRKRFWRRAFGRQKKWLEWLYSRALHWQNLPSIVYLPVENEIFMAGEAWDWQSRLVVDLLAPLELGRSFSLRDCFRLLKGYMIGEDSYPLFRRSRHPVVEYLLLLEDLGVLRRLEHYHFVKLQSIEFNKNIEDAIISDKLLIKRLIQSETSNLY